MHVTDVGDRYVLEALRREGGLLGGEQSGHVIWLATTSRATGWPPRSCSAARSPAGRSSDAAAVMPVFPQVKENVRVADREVPQRVLEEAARVNEELAGNGRVLVRPSGTEPSDPGARRGRKRGRGQKLCGRIATLVREELG